MALANPLLYLRDAKYFAPPPFLLLSHNHKRRRRLDIFNSTISHFAYTQKRKRSKNQTMSQSSNAATTTKSPLDIQEAAPSSPPTTITKSPVDHQESVDHQEPVKTSPSPKIPQESLDYPRAPAPSASPKMSEKDLDNQEATRSSTPPTITTSSPGHQEPSQSSTPPSITKTGPKEQEDTDSLASPKLSKRAFDDQDESLEPPRKRSKSPEETRSPVKLSPGFELDFANVPTAKCPGANESQTAAEMAATIPTKLENFGTIPSKGLYNPGVLCYRISAIQILLHNPKFVSWIKQYHGEDDCVGGKDGIACLTCTLRDLTALYWSRGINGHLLDNVMASLDRILADLLWNCGGTNGQGDPDDQWRFMLNRMEEEMLPEAYKALTNISTIVLDSSMKCDLCGSVSKKENCEEGLLSINLHPKPKQDKRRFVQLEQFLKQHFQGDLIGGHRCEKCHKESDKSRTWAITSAPETLTIQFKRFDWEGRKDNMNIGYPATLDLGPYMADKATPAQYSLNGVITHQGRNTSSGHYRALVKQPASGAWSLLDDEETSPSTITKVLEPSTQYRHQIPYILTYTKVSNNDGA